MECSAKLVQFLGMQNDDCQKDSGDAGMRQMATKAQMVYWRKVKSGDSKGRIRLLSLVAASEFVVANHVLLGVFDGGCNDTLAQDLASLNGEERLAVASVISQTACFNSKSKANSLLLQLVSHCAKNADADSFEPSKDAANCFLLLRDICANLSQIASRISTPTNALANVNLSAFAVLDALARDSTFRRVSSDLDLDSDSAAEGRLVAAISFKLRWPNSHPLYTPVMFTVEAIDASCVSETREESDLSSAISIVNFLFSNLHTRSHSRLFSIALLYSHRKPQLFIEALKRHTESAIQSLQQLEATFGLACTYLIESSQYASSDSSDTAHTYKDNFYPWLAMLASSNDGLGRKSHQFLVTLLRDIYPKLPFQFNVSILQALRNSHLAVFKPLWTDIKAFVAEKSAAQGPHMHGIPEKVLLDLGLPNPNGIARSGPSFEKILQEFGASVPESNGEMSAIVQKGAKPAKKTIPKALFMEILVNDGWYKTSFLPKLMHRSENCPNETWALQQELFDALRKSGRIPASVLSSASLSSTASTLIQSNVAANLNEIRTLPQPLSLADLDTLKCRLADSLQILVELEWPIEDPAFEQDCVSGVATIFSTVQNLLAKNLRPSEKKVARFSADVYGELECCEVVCNQASLTVVECFLNALTKLPLPLLSKGGQAPETATERSPHRQLNPAKRRRQDSVVDEGNHEHDARIRQLVNLFTTRVPACFPALILRLYSLLYGDGDQSLLEALDTKQCALLARILFHVLVAIPTSSCVFTAKLTDGDDGESNSRSVLDSAKNIRLSPPSSVQCFNVMFKKCLTLACGSSKSSVYKVAHVMVCIIESKLWQMTELLEMDSRELEFVKHSQTSAIVTQLKRMDALIVEREASLQRHDYCGDMPMNLIGDVGAFLEWMLWEMSWRQQSSLLKRLKYIKSTVRSAVSLLQGKTLSEVDCVSFKNGWDIFRIAILAIVEFATNCETLSHLELKDYEEGIMCMSTAVYSCIPSNTTITASELFSFLNPRRFKSFFRLFGSVFDVNLLWVGCSSNEMASVEKTLIFWETHLAGSDDGSRIPALATVEWNTVVNAVILLLNGLVTVFHGKSFEMLNVALLEHSPTLSSVFLASDVVHRYGGLTSNAVLSSLVGKDLLQTLKQDLIPPLNAHPHVITTAAILERLFSTRDTSSTAVLDEFGETVSAQDTNTNAMELDGAVSSRVVEKSAIGLLQMLHRAEGSFASGGLQRNELIVHFSRVLTRLLLRLQNKLKKCE
ncbi:hypothetical protein BJ741DRAFT_589354 [Chytriomyces cf. hyalinus JEL632]|nr:hypothetical protein BJ741DRAFT_589354 [Chytriomyces cf. hyalinus JEL632]